jgi:hypothetical protein
MKIEEKFNFKTFLKVIKIIKTISKLIVVYKREDPMIISLKFIKAIKIQTKTIQIIPS